MKSIKKFENKKVKNMAKIVAGKRVQTNGAYAEKKW